MEQVFEMISNLTLKDEPVQTKPFYKIGLLNDSRMFENEIISENFKFTTDNLKSFSSDKRCSLIQARTLNDDEKLLFKPKTDDEEQLHNDLLNHKSDCFSLGSSMELIDQILDNKVNSGIGFIKLFKDFESLVVKLTLEKHKLKRILFLNWDIKHSFDVQEKFYNNSKVLSISIHHFTNETSLDSDFVNIGSDPNGKGYNINIPLNQTDFGDEEYIAALYNIILPIAYEFNTQLIIISTSFNAANESNKFSSNAYEHFLNSLSCLANGKICLLVNEKNESPKFTECVTSSLKALFGYPCTRLRTLYEPNKILTKTILNCISVLRPYWYCIQLLNDNDTVTLDDYLTNHKNTKIETKNNEKTKRKNIKQNENCDSLNDFSKELSLIESKRTCICSDDGMLAHYDLINPNHPERPDRIKRIIELLKERGLYDLCGRVDSRLAKEEELNLCHPQSYINDLKLLKSKSIDELAGMSKNMNSVYFNKKTFECATLATGSLLSVVDNVCSKKYVNGVAVIRPPGHHANSQACSGFCFFNSVAVACRYAQKKYRSVRKVLILDFDVHHGNGTQEIFEEDDTILFISLHRYDNGCFYPLKAASNYTDIGIGKGKGFTLNIPWNQSSAGDGEYVSAFLKVVMPVCYQFNPDLVLVSAGFDAAIGDPLGGYCISPSGYSQMTKMLTMLANGNVILALEGGYNLTAISESMCNCVSVLLGDICPSITTLATKPQAFDSLKNVVNTHKTYWNCLKFDDKLPQSEFIKKQKKSKNKLNKTETNYSLRSRLPKPNIEGKENSSDESRESPNILENHLTQKAIKNDLKDESLKSDIEILDLTPTEASVTISMSETINGIVPGTYIDPIAEEQCGYGAEGGYDPNTFYTAVAVVPLTYCEHLELIRNRTYNPELFDAYGSCLKCADSSENWICLTCNQIFCSRFVNGHMAEHYEDTKHPMVLSFSDISVWCYECDSYVHNPILSDVKLYAYNSKFNV